MSRKSRKQNRLSKKRPRAPFVTGIDGDGNVVRVVVNSNHSHSPDERDAAYKEQILTNWLQNDGLYHDVLRDKCTDEEWLARHANIIEERRAASRARQSDGLDSAQADEVAGAFAESIKAAERQPSPELRKARTEAKRRMAEPIDVQQEG